MTNTKVLELSQKVPLCIKSSVIKKIIHYSKLETKINNKVHVYFQ